jgi:hypothetical protein
MLPLSKSKVLESLEVSSDSFSLSSSPIEERRAVCSESDREIFRLTECVFGRALSTKEVDVELRWGEVGRAVD